MIRGSETRMFKNIGEDLRAYGGNWGAQGFWAMVVYRFGRWRYRFHMPRNSGGLTYLFDAQIAAQSGWPYDGAISPTVIRTIT